ncbi:MAG TPA: hypothetical protein VF014_09775 [Casimicrobiaceae bacterium]|nr:hypothetical protein [Casimicrobiaceae bacterium]
MRVGSAGSFIAAAIIAVSFAAFITMLGIMFTEALMAIVGAYS